MHSGPEFRVPIWFFVGVTLAIYGFLIAATGLYRWIVPPERPLALAHLHADLWWGLFLGVVGLGYTLRFRPGRKP